MSEYGVESREGGYVGVGGGSSVLRLEMQNTSLPRYEEAKEYNNWKEVNRKLLTMTLYTFGGLPFFWCTNPFLKKFCPPPKKKCIWVST